MQTWFLWREPLLSAGSECPRRSLAFGSEGQRFRQRGPYDQGTRMDLRPGIARSAVLQPRNGIVQLPSSQVARDAGAQSARCLAVRLRHVATIRTQSRSRSGIGPALTVPPLAQSRSFVMDSALNSQAGKGIAHRPKNPRQSTRSISNLGPAWVMALSPPTNPP